MFCRSLKVAMVHTLHHQYLLIILFLPFFTLAQNNGIISVRSSITATENANPWLSTSGDFAFGFQQLQNNSDLFVLSIWFNRIPDRTIVWFERSSNPVPRGSVVQLNATQGLVLWDPRGRSLWNSPGFTDAVSYGFMNDTGNFILCRSDSTRLWESFRNPSDTILPSQTIELNDILISKATDTNFSEGKFFARFNETGSFVLRTQSVPSNTYYDAEYYSSQTSDVNVSNSGYRLLFNERGSIFIVMRNGQQAIFSRIAFAAETSDFYYKATLNTDGVFTHSYHSRTGNLGWTIAMSWPDNICFNINGERGSGACGYNSICRLHNQRPICQCLQGYSLADPNNAYGDCKPSFSLNCIDGMNGSDAFSMVDIVDVDFPYHDYQIIDPSTANNCRNACLNDCLCGVALFTSGSCRKKRLPLSNGRVDTTQNMTGFLKLEKADVPQLSPNNSTRNPKSNQITFVVALGILLFIICLFVVATCIYFFLIRKKKFPFNQSLDSSNIGSNLRCFTYKELVQCTNGFKQELGKGAFGIVYKGVIKDGSRSIVAVKKLDRLSQDSEKEFRAEVNAIGQTHHKNLVRLLGFCSQGLNRLLVYEYMSNGTLAEFLFGNPKPSWCQRTQIALGVARGITYLHEECSSQIIHCDIKPQNILLDEYHNARISDFGLAKLLVLNQSRTITNIRGTKGYVAPEWFRNMPITAKVDVYSFGVLLLEIISCRKSLEADLEFEKGENPILTDWVWDCFEERRLDTLVDNDEEALNDKERMERFVNVGIWCIQEDSAFRPNMKKALQMLEGIVEVAVPPCPSLFS